MSLIKATLRLPTSDQYAFIEITQEVESIQDAVDSYKEGMALLKPQIGLSAKDYNTALDRYLSDGTGEVETYMLMSPEQQRVFQEIKKAFKRLNYNKKDE